MYKVLIGLCVSVFLSVPAFAEQLKFVQVTDVHVSIDRDSYRGRDLAGSAKTVADAVESINNISDLDFVMFSGDNIDSWKEDYLKAFCEITQKLKKPYYIALGNHDTFQYSSLNKKNYFKFVRKYDKYLKSDKSYYYFFPDNDFVVIILDGSQLIPNTHGLYPQEQLTWMDGLLTKYADKKAIIIQHFPVVEPHKHKSHRVVDVEDYFKVLDNHKNVIAVVSGHYHNSKVTIVNGVYHISTSALVEAPHNYRVIEINYDKKSLFSDDPKFELKTQLVPVGE